MNDIDPDRKIHIIGDIDYDAYRKFTKRMDYLEREIFGGAPVHIVLSSEGGDAKVALAFYDRIRMSRCVISITGVGLVASAAALILVAPPDVARRSLTKNSWLMVHDDNVEANGVSKNDRIVLAQKKLDQLTMFEDQWNELMAASTTSSAENWKRLHEDETYLTPEECVALGVIGEII